jgi:hypothetical protein
MGTNTNRNRGKRLERFVAKATGGKRIGILGDVDVITKDTIIECKSRNRCEVDKFMRQIEKHQNKYPDHTPVVWIHITGTQHTEDIICIRAKHTINNIPEED